jgi:hypothetical protein
MFSKKTLAKFLFRIRVEIFGRPQYDRYYEFIREQRLPVDTRAIRRARWKRNAYTTLLAIVLCEATNFYVASTFAFAAFTANWPFPPAMLTWIYHQLMTQSPDGPTHAAITAINNHALSSAIIAITLDIVLLIGFAQAVYWSNRNDRWLLSTEKGAANWILPEKLAESGILPLNYDIYAGFEDSEWERIAHDAALQRDHTARIARYSTEYAEWQAEQNPDGKRLAITLPVYGAADAMFQSSATQTDAAAPWYQPETKTAAMPKAPIEITLPAFEERQAAAVPPPVRPPQAAPATPPSPASEPAPATEQAEQP